MIIVNDIDELNTLDIGNSAVTIGKFDGLHRGHRLLINRICMLKEKGLSSVGCMIEMGKNGIISHEERDRVLESMGVDYLVIMRFTEEFAKMSPEEFIFKFLKDKLSAKEVVVGSDFRFGYKREGNVGTLKKFEDKYDYKCEFYDKLEYNGEVISSTIIRDALADGNILLVKAMLGRDYKIEGEIIHGQHMGTGIGFPTINLSFEKERIVPRCGVYASRIKIAGNEYKGISNIGRKPTAGEFDVNVETNIFDFDKDVYGENAEVIPEKFIRDEMKFGSFEELKNQIARDVESVKKAFE